MSMGATVTHTSGNWVRDLMTKRGETALRQETLGDYLNSLGVYDPQTKQVTFDTNELTPRSIQRIALPIEDSMIKQLMLEDILQGGLLPPSAVCEMPTGRKILDGLQRADVEAQGLDFLLRHERGDSSSIPSFAQRIIQKVGHRLLHAEEYLQRPVFLQVWRNLSDPDEDPDELLRLFMVLNIGQHRISSHHQSDTLEVLFPYFYQMFRKWNLPTTTTKKLADLEQKKIKKIGRSVKWLQEHDSPIYMFRYLVNGVIAYVEGNPHVASKLKIEDLNQYHDSVNIVYRKLMDIGDEAACSDFTWVCNELNAEISRIYEENRKWRVVIMASDNFFLPLMAALGKARQDSAFKQDEKLERHKHEILELLRAASPQSDPLQFYSPPDQCLESIQKQVRSNIGRTHRAIVYRAWLAYFQRGHATPTTVLDWREIPRGEKQGN